MRKEVNVDEIVNDSNDTVLDVLYSVISTKSD
jgi:hypothetical protein